jgi:hypothetical protein
MPQNPLNWSAANLIVTETLKVAGSLVTGAAAIVAKSNFLAPLPADTTSSTPVLVTQVTPTDVALTIAVQPPQSRKLLVQIIIGTPTTTAVTAGTCTLVGFDQDNNPVTEVIALACTVSTVFKSKWAYSSITSATVAAYAASGSGTGNKIAIGQSNDFGIPTGVGVANFALVKSTKIITTVTGAVTGWARAVTDDNAAGATVDAVARTVAPTTAPGVAGINDYEFTCSYTLAA